MLRLKLNDFGVENFGAVTMNSEYLGDVSTNMLDPDTFGFNLTITSLSFMFFPTEEMKDNSINPAHNISYKNLLCSNIEPILKHTTNFFSNLNIEKILNEIGIESPIMIDKFKLFIDMAVTNTNKIIDLICNIKFKKKDEEDPNSDLEVIEFTEKTKKMKQSLCNMNKYYKESDYFNHDVSCDNDIQ